MNYSIWRKAIGRRTNACCVAATSTELILYYNSDGLYTMNTKKKQDSKYTLNYIVYRPINSSSITLPPPRPPRPSSRQAHRSPHPAAAQTLQTPPAHSPSLTNATLSRDLQTPPPSDRAARRGPCHS